MCWDLCNHCILSPHCTRGMSQEKTPSVMAETTFVSKNYNVVGWTYLLWCAIECESNTSDLPLLVRQPTLTELKSWLCTVVSIDCWVFNVWPIVTEFMAEHAK